MLGHRVAVVEDVARAPRRSRLRRVRAQREPADVVHDRRAARDRRLRHLALVRVDRDEVSFPHECRHRGRRDRRLCLRLQLRAARASRLRPHVDDVGAFGPQLLRVRQRRRHVGSHPVAREGVVGQVHDAHHEGLVEREFVRTRLPALDRREVARERRRERAPAPLQFRRQPPEVARTGRHTARPVRDRQPEPERACRQRQPFEVVGEERDVLGFQVRGQRPLGRRDQAQERPHRRGTGSRPSMRRACQRCSRSCL